MKIERGPQGHFFDGDRYDTCPLCPNEPEPFRPTVGWLVCTQEPRRGMDFRLHPGFNSLGSGPRADISLPWERIRDPAALVYYDEAHSLFTFGPTGGGTAAVNGTPVEEPVVLHPHDRLTLGDTTLVFVPLPL